MKRFARGLQIACVASLGLSSAEACAQALPDIVKQPTDLNLGNTSFFDGFGAPMQKEGLTFINYGRFNFFNKLADQNGGPNALFNSPELQVQAGAFQFFYKSPLRTDSGTFGFNTVVAVANLSSQFHQGGIILKSNRFGLTDLAVGPFYQSDPVIRDGRPVFSYRFEFDTLAPIGALNKSVDINQGSGFFSLNPYVAMTYLPTPKVELSTRLHYLYNFESTALANPPPIPGLVYRNGQAGQAFFANFDASYAFTDKISIGPNGYYFHQLEADKLNGQYVANSRQEMLYLGPGAHVTLGERDFLNLNCYLPVEVRNTFSGPQFNYQYIHVF